MDLRNIGWRSHATYGTLLDRIWSLRGMLGLGRRLVNPNGGSTSAYKLDSQTHLVAPVWCSAKRIFTVDLLPRVHKLCIPKHPTFVRGKCPELFD